MEVELEPVETKQTKQTDKVSIQFDSEQRNQRAGRQHPAPRGEQKPPRSFYFKKKPTKTINKKGKSGVKKKQEEKRKKLEKFKERE